MKVGTVIGFTVGVSLAYLLTAKITNNFKDKSKQVIKEKLNQLLD